MGATHRYRMSSLKRDTLCCMFCTVNIPVMEQLLPLSCRQEEAAPVSHACFSVLRPPPFSQLRGLGSLAADTGKCRKRPSISLASQESQCFTGFLTGFSCDASRKNDQSKCSLFQLHCLHHGTRSIDAVKQWRKNRIICAI